MTFLTHYIHKTTMPMWCLGAFVATVGAILTALGMTLQSYAHVRIARNGKGTKYYLHPCWQTGMFTFTVGQLLNVVAMLFAPQAMLSCLGALSLIFNAIFARTILKEQTCMMQGGAMSGMVVGVLLVVAFTPTPLTTIKVPNPANILPVSAAGADTLAWAPLVQPGFLLLTASLGAVLVLFRLLAVYAGVGLKLVPLFWAFVTAVKRGYAIVLFKCAALFLAAEPANPGSRPEVWTLVFLAALLCVSQTHTLNLGLAEGSAMVVLPVFYACSIVMQIIMAGIAFGELSHFNTPTEAVAFGSGVCVVVACIALMVRAKVLADANAEEEASAKMKMAPRCVLGSKPVEATVPRPVADVEAPVTEKRISSESSSAATNAQESTPLLTKQHSQPRVTAKVITNSYGASSPWSILPIALGNNSAAACLVRTSSAFVK